MDEEKRRQLRDEKRRLLKQIRSLHEAIRGSVVVLRRRCSYPGCRRCAAGFKHPALYHTVSKNGKTQTTYLGERLAPACRDGVESYRRLTERIERLSQINLALLIGKER